MLKSTVLKLQKKPQRKLNNMSIFTAPKQTEVQETKGVSIKPGIFGRTDVLLDGHVQRSFPEVRQARVFAAHLEHAQKSK